MDRGDGVIGWIVAWIDGRVDGEHIQWMESIEWVNKEVEVGEKRGLTSIGCIVTGVKLRVLVCGKVDNGRLSGLSVVRLDSGVGMEGREWKC